MTRTTTMAVALAALAIACSKDGAEPGATTPETATGPGVSAASAHELGPQAEAKSRTVPVTSSSPDALAAFERGRELVENIRMDEARVALEEAIELDPEFALAHAYLASCTDETKARELADLAIELSAAVPQAEQLAVKSIVYKRLKEQARHSEALEQLAAIAPDDFRVQMWRGQDLLARGDYQSALPAFERASQLAPSAPEPYNYLAYANAHLGNLDAAVAAARSYAKKAPDEPNPRDSLGEILMMAGELEPAENAFREAVKINPSFAIARQGVALAQMYRGEYAAGVQELQARAEQSPEGWARIKALDDLAWAQLGAGDGQAALGTVTRMQSLAKQAGIEGYAHEANALRAQILLHSGKIRDARRKIDAAMKHDETPKRVAWSRVVLLQIQIAADDFAGATTTLAAIEAEQEAGAYYANAQHFARGELAMARGDAKAALEHYGAIEELDVPYGVQAAWRSVDALRAAGKVDAAAKLKETISRQYVRNVFAAAMRQRHTAG